MVLIGLIMPLIGCFPGISPGPGDPLPRPIAGDPTDRLWIKMNEPTNAFFTDV